MWSDEDLGIWASRHLFIIGWVSQEMLVLGQFLNRIHVSKFKHVPIFTTAKHAKCLAYTKIEWKHIKFQTITHHFYCHRTTKFEELCTIKVAWGCYEKLKKVFFVNHGTILIFFTFPFHKEWSWR